MAEVRSDVKEEVGDKKKKGAFGKLKEAILPDASEQAVLLSDGPNQLLFKSFE